MGYQTYKSGIQDSNVRYWEDRAEKAEDVVRQLATMLSAAREPSGLISAAADTYPYAKAEVLAKAERILDGLPEPTSGTCGHCAQSYGLQAKLTRVEEITERMRMLPQDTAYTHGIAYEFSEAIKDE